MPLTGTVSVAGGASAVTVAVADIVVVLRRPEHQ